jgi:N-acetyltransferase
MSAWTTVVLEGELVRLEPMSLAHEDGLWEAARDARTWEWLSVVQPQTRGEMRAYLEAALANAADGIELPLVTVWREDGRVIGSTRYLALRPEHRSIEIGWTWLTPEVWGTGANVEAKLLMLEHAFERVGAMRVEFKTDARNVESRRALEALPATFEGILRKHMVIHAGIRDSAYYAITDDDWPAVKMNLERRLQARR